MTDKHPKMTLIGFGEAGSTFAHAGSQASGWGAAACAYDIADARRSAMDKCGVSACHNAAEALDGAELVLSLVTADAALPAAQEYSAALAPGTVWCDMNSVAPETKRAAAKAVEAAGGRYVDVAVMSPVHPAALNVPLLLSGKHAGDAATMLNALGFMKTRIVGDEIGRASSIKMIRSVMVKGMEALTSECAAGADAAGVFEEVMASLDASEQPVPWSEKIAYNRERMEVHGLRRAAEMEEAAKTLLDLGIEPIMTAGTVTLQRRAAGAKTQEDKA